MTDLVNYLRYFQQIANEHVDISDFYVMDINEPLAALRSDIKYPALILNSLAGNLRVPNADNTLDNLNGGFLIIKHLDNIDDFVTEMDILSDMKQIGVDIISRMIYDKKRCEPLAQKSIAGFDPNSVQYEMMGPVFDNDFGFMFSFKIISSISLGYDPNKWDTSKTIEGKHEY